MHPSSSSNFQQPWHFDATIYPDIIVAENLQDDRPYRLVKGGNLDYKRVQKLYDESPIPGYTIALVEVIYDQRMQERFEVELNFLEQRANENAGAPFKANWVEECASPEEKKARQHVFNHLVKRSQTPSGFRHVKVLPMFHATKEALVDSIIRVGFTVLAKRKDDHNDPGYYGKGIYHTSSAKYGYGVYGSDLILLYNWASYFAAYPIVHNNGDWLEKHAGKEHYKNYDAHYVLVNPLDPNNPNENSYFPIQGTEKHTYDELVTFQSNQILPRYIVHLEPTGLNLKQVPTKTDSIFDSILGLFSNKIELTVSTLIQEINTYLQSTKRLEIEKSLNNPIKTSLEASLKLKSISLSKKNLNVHLDNEEAWILRQLLCIKKNKNEKIARLLLNALCARIIVQNTEITFVGLLQSYYKSKNSIPRLFKPPLHIEENYVQLVLVESQRTKHAEKPSFDSGNLSSRVDLDSLFEIKNKSDSSSTSSEYLNVKPLRHLAIVGRAGIGKSTLCQYICYQWANGKLWNDKFEGLIWIPLRQLIHMKEEDTLYDLIHRFCILPSGRKEISSDQIKEYIFQKEDKVLFVLDGYDEISGSLHEGSLIKGIMDELLQQKRVLITTRGHAAHELKVDRAFENIGFSPSHVTEYIAKNLPSNYSRTLKSQLKRQSWLAAIANVPLNLELICSTWEGQDRALFESMSTLYIKFTLDLLRRFLVRRGLNTALDWEMPDFEAKYSAELQFLEQLAWEGLVQKNLVMSLKDEAYHTIYLKHRPKNPEARSDFTKAILEIGLVRVSGTSSMITGQEFEFPHLTFQEFFAAKYICRCLAEHNISEVSRLVRLHKFNPQFQLVWSFVAGILKDEPQNLNLYFQLLDETIDFVGFYDFQLKMRCREEVKWNVALPNLSKDLQSISGWLQWIDVIPNVIDEPLLRCLKSNVLLKKKVGEIIDFSQLSAKMSEFLTEAGYHKAYFSYLEATDVYSYTLRFVYNALNPEEQDKFGEELLQSGSREEFGDFIQEWVQNNLLEKLIPSLFQIIRENKNEEFAFDSAVMLLGMGETHHLNLYPEIIPSLIDLFKQNLNKSSRQIIFESLFCLLVHSVSTQTSSFFLMMDEVDLISYLNAFVGTSLQEFIRIYERLLLDNSKSNKFERILTSAIHGELRRYNTGLLDAIASSSSPLLKKKSLEIVYLWVKEQVSDYDQGVSDVLSFLSNESNFYWTFKGLKNSSFHVSMFNVLQAYLEDILDLLGTVFEKESAPNFFRALRLLSSFTRDIPLALYRNNPEKTSKLLLEMLAYPTEAPVAIALLGLISKNAELTPELSLKIGQVFKENYIKLKYPYRFIAEYNLCSFVSRDPEYVLELLPILPRLLNLGEFLAKFSRVHPIPTYSFVHIKFEAFRALNQAFKDRRYSKKIGEALIAVYRQKKVALYEVRKLLIDWSKLYPEKKQDIVYQGLKQLKDKHLEEPQAISAFLDNASKYPSTQALSVFEDICFFYELMLDDDKYLEQEKQHILNDLLSLLIKRDVYGKKELLDCFTLILFSKPESSTTFVKHMVSVLGQVGMLEDFITSCSNRDSYRRHLGFQSANESSNTMLSEAISFALSSLKGAPYSKKLDKIAEAMVLLKKLSPGLTNEFIEFALSYCDKQTELLSGDSESAWREFFSICDLTLIPITSQTLFHLISRPRWGSWGCFSTPFPHLIDKVKNDFSLLKILFFEIPEMFSEKYIVDFMKRINQDEVNRETYLRVVLFICIRESIALFMMDEEICYYRNGLQKYKVSDPKWFVETSQALSKTLVSDLKSERA